ncbi:hypothetical protein C8A03DRAFT_38840 [Achaetomium macrosporum]|uniref:Uncharacterized protein n=1 Tax=Achaetomium macrosporum TaxID=79813 RepID=A0AAN7H6Y4_9PEZI|nr:hypothetical protein C8A03DRAFT_38840 [Achaetomium macrosporum]
MVYEEVAMRGRPMQGNQSQSFQQAKMDRLALGQVVLRMQAEHIRSSLATEIEEFENTFEQILQTTNAFLAATESAGTVPSFVIIDQDSVVKIVCQFLASSNTILEFLDFQEKKTGLASGGDSSLEKQVKAAQALVEQLLTTLRLHEKAESYPGKEFGFVYNEDVKLFGDVILHKHLHVDPINAPDPNLEMPLDRLREYWHVEENVFSPLRQVPGTDWHKFFGNLQTGPLGNLVLFRERKAPAYFKVMFPETIDWLMPEIESQYDKYREVFEVTRRLPGPRLPYFIRMAKIRKIQKRLSNLFVGWKRHEDPEVLNFEDTREIPCPEHDHSGLSRLESLNAEINAVELTGVALPGDEIPRIPDYLEGEARRYCLEFDGMWD